MTMVAPADHSRLVRRVRRRLAPWLSLLPPGPPDAPTMRLAIQTLQAQGQSLEAALRITRNLVVERLVVIDVENGLGLQAVTRAMTDLAEVTLNLALTQALQDADAKHGMLRNAQGERLVLWVVGMGKLGASELNVSSDIDLIYVIEDDAGDGVPGNPPVDVYTATVARRLQSLIGDVTDDGFVFRVDLALRPNGNAGPAVVGLSALESYFVTQGREWERLAWLKARVVAPTEAVETGRIKPLMDVVTPFVYRRYLDYSVFASLRHLHRLVREEAARRARGRPERANDVKLARGGIREIEFIVQLLQIVRGGQRPQLRTRATLDALRVLSAEGLMAEGTALALADAYTFLRHLEHRIQYLDDEQTHVLPTDAQDLGWIARSLGLATRGAVAASAIPPLDAIDQQATAALQSRLHAVREVVATEFDALLHDGRDREAVDTAASPDAVPEAADPATVVQRLPATLQPRVAAWMAQPRWQSLRETSKHRLGLLLERAGAAVASGEVTEQAGLSFIDWLEPLLRRDSYLALLAEQPLVQQRLLRLLGMARWPLAYLMRHPAVIDELADARLLGQRFDGTAYTQALQTQHAAWQHASGASAEPLLDALRHAHHGEVFRTLVRDVEGRLSVEQVADELSALADATLAATLQWAWQQHTPRHRDDPALAIIAYGKLGGKELGYGSDLDIVFLHDDPDEGAGDVYSRFVRKLITWLTSRTGAGELFDIDTALRPNGNAGLLVTSMASFEAYQLSRGSNTAWTWEHQAITRARWCAGDARLAGRFDAVRRGVLTASRDPAALRDEIRSMRERVRQAKPVPSGLFDVKHSVGGMMDIEFAVQHVVLAHAQQHEGLHANVGNIALLQRCESVGLLPAGLGQASAHAYRVMRHAQHQARLNEAPSLFDVAHRADLAQAQRDGQALWAQVFASSGDA
jgi:[glutamine synthetase] adenylyltransferase / [glutamine synthetase]-adenylyl-L-tyrosine phosphorylase